MYDLSSVGSPKKGGHNQRNGWSQCSGMGGHNAAESVVSLQRNEWSQCGGIRILAIKLIRSEDEGNILGHALEMFLTAIENA